MASRTIRRRAGLRTFVQLDEVAQLIRRAHGEAGLSGGDAMAAAEAAETRKATSRKGRAPSAPEALATCPRPRRSPGKAKPVRRRRPDAMSCAIPATFRHVEARKIIGFGPPKDGLTNARGCGFERRGLADQDERASLRAKRFEEGGAQRHRDREGHKGRLGAGFA